MKALINYINKNPGIRRMAFVLEHDNTLEEIIPIFFSHSFEMVYFFSSKAEYLCKVKKRCYEMKKNMDVSMPEIVALPYEYMNGIHKKDGMEMKVDAVFFDSSVYFKTIDSLFSFKPKWILGRIWETETNSFAVWEKFRDVSDHIYLENIKANGEVKTLDWKREEFEVELSVVFPVYKVEKYLEKCIETVTAWKAPYVEFLFVDDGSPDHSAEMIETYGKKDTRIKLIRKPNGGCASARKKGMEAAKGRYIGFFDPDDFIDVTMYQKLFMKALNGGYDICYCGYNKYYENSGQIEKVADALGHPYTEGIHDLNKIHRLIFETRVAIWRGIYKRDFLEKSKISFYEDLKRFDDLPFKVETFAKAKSVIAVPEYLYYYRLERPGQDVACDDERLYVHFDIFKHLDEFIGRTKDRYLFDYLQIVKVQTHFYALEKIQKRYFKEYIKRVREDIKKDAGFFRTVLLLRGYAGREYILPYCSIMLHLPFLYQMWMARNKKKSMAKDKNRNKILRQLNEMYK